MKDTIRAWEPQIRSVMRIMAAYMILLHALREVFGVMPAPRRGPGSFMALDHLGQPGGVLLLVLGALLLIGWLIRPVSILLAIQCAVAYAYAAMPRGAWPIKNGGIDDLTYVLVLAYMAAAAPDAWSIDGLRRNKAMNKRIATT
jgi:putative oxidoreductase